MSSFQPQAFGKYYLVDKIATGGMAEIFKAKTYSHGGFENLLVIKRILPHIGENEDFIEMFIDEAKVSVALQHRNIVRIYDFGKILENYFIAMECVDGKDVRNVLRKLARSKRYMPPDFAALVAHEVCKGLGYAHAKADNQGNAYGIVHRDISPSNVIIAYEGEVKVADFGIAKAESNAYETRDGVLKGKFEYMSPEQATGKEIDSRSDLFSLGIILYEMLTGRRLFKTDSEISTLRKIRDCDFKRPSQLNPKIPAPLEDITMRALSANPDDRFQSAQDMAEALRDYLFPNTPDKVRDDLRAFMQELFADVISEERQRLEQHSNIALQLKDSALDNWDGHTDSTMSAMSAVTQPSVRMVVPWLAGIAALLLVFVGVVTFAVAVFVAQQQTRDPVAELPDAPTHGAIEVVVLPAARVLVDGAIVGEGQTVDLSDVDPGVHVVRLEADGHIPYEQSVTVEAGSAHKVVYTLEKLSISEPAAQPEPDPQPKVASGPPRVRVESTPSGAQVRIDGSSVGTTPLTWRGGSAGSSYSLELSLDGFQTYSTTVDGLRKGRTKKVSQRLEELSEPGKVTVTLVGGGWAHVYVDGQKLAKTAPLSHTLDPGSYEIRVENAALGIDHTERVSVPSGGSVKVVGRPQ